REHVRIGADWEAGGGLMLRVAGSRSGHGLRSAPSARAWSVRVVVDPRTSEMNGPMPRARRILYVCGTYAPGQGGAEISARTFLRAFTRRGDSCTVLTQTRAGVPLRAM